MQTETILVVPSDHLLQKCIPVEPPSEQVLLHSTDLQRSVKLSEAYMEQTGVITLCNSKIDSIRNWKRLMIDHLGHEDTTIIIESNDSNSIPKYLENR